MRHGHSILKSPGQNPQVCIGSQPLPVVHVGQNYHVWPLERALYPEQGTRK